MCCHMVRSPAEGSAASNLLHDLTCQVCCHCKHLFATHIAQLMHGARCMLEVWHVALLKWCLQWGLPS